MVSVVLSGEVPPGRPGTPPVQVQKLMTVTRETKVAENLQVQKLMTVSAKIDDPGGGNVLFFP